MARLQGDAALAESEHQMALAKLALAQLHLKAGSTQEATTELTKLLSNPKTPEACDDSRGCAAAENAERSGCR